MSFIPGDIKHVVTRAKAKNTHYVSDEFMNGRSFSGFTIGRGQPLLARIYNKTKEIQSSGKEWFKHLWEENGWDYNKQIWRVEFQLRREVLKELKLDRVEDVWGKETNLWFYLTNEWLLLKDNNLSNVTRNKIKRKWQRIQQVGLVSNTNTLLRDIVKTGNMKKILDQSSGLLISIGARSNSKSINEALKLLQSYTEVKLAQKKEDFASLGEKRNKRYVR